MSPPIPGLHDPGTASGDDHEITFLTGLVALADQLCELPGHLVVAAVVQEPLRATDARGGLAVSRRLG